MSASAADWRDFQRRGGVADLGERVMLRLTGADRVRYLNGQVTADVRKLAPTRAIPACVTTAKGRLCADVFLHATADTLLVDADSSLREILAPRFERYIIADDVLLEDVSEALRLIHLLPPPGAPVATGVPFPHHLARRFGRDGLDFLLPPDAAAECLAALAPLHAILDEPLREILRIEAGVPRWGRDIGEDTLPPEAGLDLTHIDYHKGCYIGQEVISRLKSVGHVNRQLTGFTSTGGTPLASGAQLFATGDADARAIGTLTSTAWSFALEKPIALGYLRRGSPVCDLIARHADSTGAGAVVAVHPLPFIA